MRLWPALRVAFGPAVFVLLGAFLPSSIGGGARFTLATTAWVALWWILESVPAAVASLVPLVMLPLCGVRSAGQVAATYFNDLVALFLGGFLLALAIERCGLHRRVALAVLAQVGTSPRKLCIGFLCAAVVISSWISNTATALMLLPIATAVLARMRGVAVEHDTAAFEGSTMLALTYGAGIGGMCTLVGTPANVLIRGYVEVGFLQWILAVVPLASMLAVVAGWIIVRGLSDRSSPEAVLALNEERRRLPSWSSAERATAIIFVIAVVLWVTRQPIDVGGRSLLGWSRWFSRPEFIQDGTIAILASLLLFLARVRTIVDGRPVWCPLLNWDDVQRSLPWGLLLLFGGGLALGDAFEQSGLSKIMGESLARCLVDWSPLVVVLMIVCFVTAMSEVASNTATASILLPVFASLAPGMHVDKLAMLMPVVLAASMGYMLPVATGPNAVVYGSGLVPHSMMVRKGLLLDVLGGVLIAVYLRTIGWKLLGVTWESEP